MAYQTITNIFHENESDLTASEAHGLATGLLCIENSIEVATWLSQLFPEEIVLIDEDKTILVSLFEQTRKLMSDDDANFRYDLFLPGDDEPFADQIEALRFWCEGFLFGIGYSRSTSDWPGETGEIIRDIVEFSKLDTDEDEQTDEDEDENVAALMEVQEYLRVAVMMLKDQFLEESNGQQTIN